MIKKTRKWIEAANELINNPKANINCPECGIEYLKVKIEPLSEKKDMYMICDSCKKWNVIT